VTRSRTGRRHGRHPDVPSSTVLSSASTAARVAAALALAGLAGLVVAALVPQAFGMSAHVVVSGSMAPRVGIGDVVLTSPVTPAELRPGQVLLFTDPSQPDRLLLHRLVSFDADGDLVTRGDANRSEDSAHVAPSAVQGLARVRVPWVGLPAQWRGEGRFGAIALAAASLAGAAVFVTRGLSREVAVATGGATTGYRSTPEPPAPMTALRPRAAHAAARPGATATEEGRDRATSPGFTLPPVPPAAGRHPGGHRPAVPAAAGSAGAGLRAAGPHDHCFDSGRFCGQPGR
jgi:signal peptidase